MEGSGVESAYAHPFRFERIPIVWIGQLFVCQSRPPICVLASLPGDPGIGQIDAQRGREMWVGGMAGTTYLMGDDTPHHELLDQFPHYPRMI